MFKQKPQLEVVMQTVEARSEVAAEKLEQILEPRVNRLAAWMERAEDWVTTKISERRA